MTFSLRRVLPLLVLVPVLVTAGACQGSVSVGGTPTVSKSDVEAQVKTQFAQQSLTTTDVTCDDDLQGKVGASVTCAVTLDDGSTQDVTATVTSMDGTTANFDIAPAGATDTATP